MPTLMILTQNDGSSQRCTMIVMVHVVHFPHHGYRVAVLQKWCSHKVTYPHYKPHEMGPGIPNEEVNALFICPDARSGVVAANSFSSRERERAFCWLPRWDKCVPAGKVAGPCSDCLVPRSKLGLLPSGGWVHVSLLINLLWRFRGQGHIWCSGGGMVLLQVWNFRKHETYSKSTSWMRASQVWAGISGMVLPEEFNYVWFMCGICQLVSELWLWYCLEEFVLHGAGVKSAGLDFLEVLSPSMDHQDSFSKSWGYWSVIFKNTFYLSK